MPAAFQAVLTSNAARRRAASPVQLRRLPPQLRVERLEVGVVLRVLHVRQLMQHGLNDAVVAPEA